MRRIWIGSLASLVAIAAITALFAAMPARSEPKQVAISRYLAQRMQVTGQPQRVASEVRAACPQTLDASMSAATFGSGVYYRTTFSCAGAPTPAPASVQTVQLELDAGDRLRPLPYPPREVWCIWLEPPEGTRRPVVLVARHQDLYNAEWVVHEPLSETDGASALLLALGCDSHQ